MQNFNLNPIMQTIVQSIVAAAEAHINAMIDAKITAYSQQVSEAIGTLEQKIASGVDEATIKTRVEQIIASIDTVALMNDAHKDAIEAIVDEAIESHCQASSHLEEYEIERMVERGIDNADFGDKIEAAVNDLDLSGPIERAIEGYDFSGDVENALDNFDLDDKIEDCIGDYDMSEKISEYLDDNGYLTGEETKRLIKEGGMDDSVIQDAVVEVLSNLTLKVNDPTISISKY